MGFLFKYDEDLKKRDEEQVRRLDRGTEPNPTVKDLGKAVKGAIYETGAMANAGIRAATGSKAAEFREKRDALKAEAVTQGMSPGGRAMARGSFLPDENGDSAFLRNPVGYVAFNGAKQLPMLAISAIPGAAIGRGIKAAASLAKYAPAATAGTTAVMGGVLNTGDVLHGIYSELDKMGKKEWSTVPAYIQLVQQGMDYEEAKTKLIDDAVANAGPLAFATGTILNTFGVGQQLAKTGAGVAAKKGFIKGLVKGFAEEAAQEFAEEGSGNLIQQSATKFDDSFDWKQALEAASSGGVVGGVIGGGVGGMINIGKPKTPKIETVAPGNAPNATQAAAVQGAPLPPPVTPKTQPTAPATNVGPPVVASGQHTPPPGVVTKGKKYEKKKKTAAAPVVVSAVPDPAQSAALQTAVAPTVVQQAPEVVPPPPVTQNVPPEVAPPPIIRKRAQADIAPPITEEMPPPVVTPPVEQAAPPPPVEVLPPNSQAARILPDLAAEQRRQAEIDAAAAAPDMSARGTRYSIGTDESEVTDPAKHQAWRRLMRKEALKPNASPIAREAVGLQGKVGQSLSEVQKERLRELHSQWINEKPVARPAEEAQVEIKPPPGQRGKLGVYDKEVKSADDFLRVIARENAGATKEQDTETEARLAAIIDTLVNAPERRDVAEAIINSPYTKAVMGVAEKIQKGTVTPQDYEFFRAVEKDFTAQTQEELDAETSDIEEGGRGSVGMAVSDVAEASTLRTSDNDEVAVAAKPKKGVVQPESEGPASPVRKVELSAEEKAALAAKYGGKPKSKEEIAAATPKAPKPEPVTQSVTPTPRPAPKTPNPMGKLAPAKEKKGAIQKLEKRKEAMGLAGKDLLDLRRQQQAAARSGAANLEELIQLVGAYRAGIRKTYGQAAHDRINKEVEAMLASEKMAPMRAINMREAVRNILERHQKAEVYEHGDGTHHQATRTTTVNDVFDELESSGQFDLLATSTMSKAALEMIIPRLRKLAGSVKVHYLRPESSALKGPGFHAAGMYNSINHSIILDETNRKDGGWAAHVVLHEVAHAAFWRQLRVDKRTADLLEHLRVGIKAMLGVRQLVEMGLDYGFTNVDELVSETWSSPKFQKLLADIEIPDELARKIGLPRFKKHSVWSAFVDIVRRAFNFAPSTNTALEFVLAATAQLSATRLDNDTQTYLSNLQKEAWDIPELGPEMAPMRQLQGTILQAAREKSSTGFLRNLQLKTVTLHQLAQMADKVFPEGMAMKLSDIVGSIAVRRQELMSGGRDKVVALAHEMSLKHKGPVFEKFVDMTDRATSAGVNVAVPLTHPDNLHIKKGFAHSNARAVHKELHAEWQNLPQDLKDLWNKAGAFFKDAQDTLALNQLNNVVEIALGRKDAALAQRIHEGFMTEADKASFQTNEAMRIIAETKELKKIRGYYSPKMRRGDHVLTGEYIMPAKYDANRDQKTGRYLFDTRADAMAFQDEVRKLGLPILNTKTYSVDATTGKKHYTYTDPVTGVTNLGPDRLPKLYRFSKGDTGTKEVFEVNVQTKLVEFFDNKQKGLAAEEQYRKEGKYKINGLQQREDLQSVKPIVSTSQMIRLKKSMAAHDKYQKMSSAQQELLKRALDELSLSFLSSTAVQNRSKPRRNVLGASREYARNVAEYSSTSASAIASAEKQPELAKAITDLEEYADANKHQTSSMTYPRSEILAQLRSSVDNQEFKKPTRFNAVINGLLRVAFLKHLASPAYVMINMTQPFMLSLPTIGGRHGVLRTSMALTKAYNDIGFLGIMGAGLRDTASATRDLVTGMSTESADYIGDLHKRLAKAPDGKEITDMLDYLYEIGIINRDAGIEIAELINKPGVLAHVGRSMEHIARQTSVAAEVINRAATAVAAFRLERSRGASYEAAKAYTQRIVANTQGIYSYANAPELFKHPLMAIPLQFRKYSQLYYSLLANMVYKTFRGATRTEKVEAAKQLGILFMTHVAMAGALGLPTEPLKVIFGTLAWLGLPLPTWDEVERQATQYSMDMFGENFGDALVHGLPRLAGIDIHSRVGANSMLLFGTPEEANEDDWNAWVAKTAIGAPGGVVVDMLKAKEAAEEGDWTKAAGLMIPMKVVSDSIKAAESYTVGKKNAKGKQTQEPSGLTSAAIKAFGFKPAWIARQEESTDAYYKESRKRDERRQELIDEWKNSHGAGRREAQKKITLFNKGLPKDARITGATLAKALKRDKNYSKNGITPGRRNIDLLQRFLGE